MHRLHAAIRGFGAHSRATFLRHSVPLVSAAALAAISIPAWAATKPTIQTRATSAVSATGATLNGTVNANGDATLTGFEYGTSTSFGTSIAASPASVPATSTSANIALAVSGLKCGTTYYFRAGAQNRMGLVKGSTLSFNTSACAATAPAPKPPAATAPAASTNPATATATSATLNASVNPGGAATTVSFEHGTTTAYGSTVAGSPSSIAATAGGTSISAALANLACGTTYNFRVRASNSAGTTLGSNLSFATGACATQPPPQPPQPPQPTQPVPPTTGKTWYISPAGNNANSGTSESAPFKTFAKAFGAMVAGDRLFLMDGTYSEAAGTGYISYTGTGSGQPPSGRAGAVTEVRALNPGRAQVTGGLFIGRSTRKDSYIRIQGLTFIGTSTLYNADYVTVKDTGINGSFSVGTNDHDMYSDHNLVEDVWIWAAERRIIAINYRSHFNVWRRVVLRGDGCTLAECKGSGNPNVGITVYDSSDISLQNVVVVDRVLAAGAEPFADFASAQHTPDPRYYFGRNEWLGTMSVKAPDGGYYIEPDVGTTVAPTVTITNAVAWDSGGTPMNLSREGSNNLVQNVTVKASGNGDGIRVAPELKSGTLRNAIVTGSGRYAVNSSYVPTYLDVSFTASSAMYNQTSCTTGCLTVNPALKHMTRIEVGSPAKGAGYGGADIGANVLTRYGAEGSRHGEAGYNALTTTALWPWPNEDRIKSDMCATTTRGFCSTGKRLDGVHPVTLTSYIWEYLGNAVPAGIYP